MAIGRKKPRDPHAEKVRMVSRELGFVKLKEEEEVLSAIMNQRDRSAAVVESTTESHMSEERSRIMFLAMQRLAERAGTMDIVDLAGESRRIAGERGVELSLSPKDFADLRNLPPPQDIESSVRQLDAAYRSRQIIDFALWAMDEAQNFPDIEQFLNTAQERLVGIRPPRQDSRVHYGTDMADGIMRNIDRRVEARASGKTLYVDFPWASWNRQIGIHTPGKLLLMVMPDGAGKSTYGVQIAEHTAKRDLETYFIALEDDEDSIQGRLVARYAGFPYHKFIVGDISRTERIHIEQMVRGNMPPKLHFLTLPGASAQEILRELETQALCKKKAQAVVIDYLEALTPSGRTLKIHTDFYNAQGADMNNFSAYSSANGVPFICLDQMTKESVGLTYQEKRKKGRAMIAGSVYKSRVSSIIVMGENAGYSDGDGTASMNLWVEKSNNGKRLGEIKQELHGPTYTVRDRGL